VNVLIVVLSARREPWGALMDTSKATWDAEDHPQTRTLYYCGKSDQPSTDKVFYSPELTESLEDVSPRTIEAFEKALEYQWDFLARPNSSCYVHKRNLVKFCERLPRENMICGILTGGERSFLWGGCQYIFSRDVIERMVAHKDKWKRNEMDDVSLTMLAQELDIPLRSNSRCASIDMQPDGSYLCLLYGDGHNFTFTDFEDFNKAYGHFFVRVKQDLRRHEDLRIMRELKAHWR
jgi:hypothetical protein